MELIVFSTDGNMSDDRLASDGNLHSGMDRANVQIAISFLADFVNMAVFVWVVVAADGCVNCIKGGSSSSGIQTAHAIKKNPNPDTKMGISA